jgi:chromatin remodeling complex protein RSC6
MTTSTSNPTRDSNFNKMSSEFIPPSEEIQRLFSLNQPTNTDGTIKTNLPLEDFSFTEEEFAKMPSTLMKAVRRTETLLLQTEASRKASIETNNELKGIHSLIVRFAKKTLKDVEKNEVVVESNLEKGKTRGFRRQCHISDTMCEFMGLVPGTMSSRVDVNKAINEYIKNNGLIDKENAQRILPDEKLWSILCESAKGNTITYFSIQKYIKQHYVN